MDQKTRLHRVASLRVSSWVFTQMALAEQKGSRIELDDEPLPQLDPERAAEFTRKQLSEVFQLEVPPGLSCDEMLLMLKGHLAPYLY